VFQLLWRTARRRATGRAKRQSELMRRKKGSDSDGLGTLKTLAVVLFSGLVHAMLGWTLINFVDAARNADQGHMADPARAELRVIDSGEVSLLDRVVEKQSAAERLQHQFDAAGRPSFSTRNELVRAKAEFAAALDRFAQSAARWRMRELGQTEESQRRLISDHYRRYGKAGFIFCESSSLRTKLAHADQSPTMLVPLVGGALVWWMTMLVFSGRRAGARRPTPPAPDVGVADEPSCAPQRHFLCGNARSTHGQPGVSGRAHLLVDRARKPVRFLGGLGGRAPYRTALGRGRVLPDKALEITAFLRLSARSRGAVLGLMSWLGYIAMFLPLFGMQAKGLGATLVKLLAPIRDWVPVWPIRALTVGWSETPSLAQAVATGWAVAAVLTASHSASPTPPPKRGSNRLRPALSQTQPRPSACRALWVEIRSTAKNCSGSCATKERWSKPS